jgi:hypothetical protein
MNGLSYTLAAKYREENPYATLKEIAEMISGETGNPPLTNERVRQLLKKAGARTSHITATVKFICNNCGNEFERAASEASKVGKDGNCFCNLKCKVEYNSITLVCDYCHTEYKAKIYRVRNNIRKHGMKYVFCSNRCKGKWLGKNFGFGSGYTSELNAKFADLEKRLRRQGKKYSDLTDEERKTALASI